MKLHWLNNLSIKNKLIFIQSATAFFAVLICSSIFVVNDIKMYREFTVNKMYSVIRVVADNCEAPLHFFDKDAIYDILLDLAKEPDLKEAIVFDSQGKVFARYNRPGTEIDTVSFYDTTKIMSSEFSGKNLTVTQKIFHENEYLGMVILRTEMIELNRIVFSYILVALIVLLAGLLAAVLISIFLQGAISNRILSLVSKIETVAKTGDYSLRVMEEGKNDEINILMMGFNSMMEQIEIMSDKLIRSKTELETKIVSIHDAVLKATQMNFTYKIPVSEKGDELDSLAEEINTMESELERNIQKLHENEEMLRQTNIFMDSILENIPNMIFVKEAKDLRFVRFNNAGEKLLGYSRNELIGKNDYDFFPTDQADFFTSKDREVMSGNGVHDIPEEPIDTRYQGRRYLHTQKICIKDSKGKPLYLLGISEDITERKKTEEKIIFLNRELSNTVEDLKMANAELESFSYSVSHDLRAPIRAINGFTKLILDKHAQLLDAEGKDFLNIVTNEAVRMGHLIDDLLTFSRLGKKEIQKHVVDMTALTREVVDILNRSEKYKAEIIIKDLSPGLCDPDLIRQVWINLITNALKFSSLKEKPLVEIGSYLDPGSVVYFVKDNGVGFNMKYYEKLFGVFQRLHTAEEFAGTGIGLPIVKRIILRHGGKVWAESKENEGATFYFSLPSA